jgi:hypothetical protein
MPSSDIFQGHMTRIFYDFEDIIVYIENIILFTKLSFQNHIQRLALILERIKSQNSYVHIEKTFKSTNQVDYLDYTLSPKGIKPKNQKILAVLALAEPKNKRQIRIFLGFVDFYRQL